MFGVLLAGLIVASGKASPLALVGDDFANAATIVGSICFVAVTLALYRWVARLAAG